jgi:hypothetical protein
MHSLSCLKQTYRLTFSGQIAPNAGVWSEDLERSV